MVVTVVIKEGSAKRVLWVADESGRFRGRTHFESLSLRDQTKFEALFERMAISGQIRAKDKFRHEGNQIYCFKVFKQRLACFMDGGDVLITNGFAKKSDRGRRLDREIAIAARIRSHYTKGGSRCGSEGAEKPV